MKNKKNKITALLSLHAQTQGTQPTLPDFCTEVRTVTVSSCENWQTSDLQICLMQNKDTAEKLVHTTPQGTTSENGNFFTEQEENCNSEGNCCPLGTES